MINIPQRLRDGSHTGGYIGGCLNSKTDREAKEKAGTYLVIIEVFTPDITVLKSSL